MTMIVSARRRQAEDLQRLLDGGRVSTPEAARELAPLVGLARGLSPAVHAPSAEFRSALRERLVAEAAARVPAPAVPARRHRPSAPSRLKQAVAAVAVASVVSGVGAAVASTRALPGDALYGLKRQVESVQLDLARGDLANGREHLQQADARLSEAERLAAGEHGSDPASVVLIAQALDDLDAATTQGVADLRRAYQETGDEEPLLLLDRFVAEQRERLDDLIPLLDPSLRPRALDLADQLARLDRQLSALLGSTVGALAPEALTASGDGWAVGRLAGRATAAVTTTATGTGGAGTPTSAGSRATTSSGAGVVEDVVDAVGDAAGAATGTGSTGAGGTGPVAGIVDGLTGGSTSGAPAAPIPVPTVVVPPLPLPTPVATDPVGGATGAVPTLPVPLPPVPCVPVAPLTTC